MDKKAYFYVDDVIWCFRDIARQRPASIFDQLFLKILKEAHDKYGLRVMLNCFYRTDYFYGDDEFTLAEMPDDYKAEWEANSDWIKIGYHAKQEFPDYPHVNIDYDDMKNIYTRFATEVKRFAGEKILSKAFNPHWSPVSKDGVRALRDCGIKLCGVTSGERREYNGDPNTLPYGHALRLLNNRKPETMVFGRESRDVAISNSLCAYNHISDEEAERIGYTTELIYNEEMGVYFKKYWNSACLNHTPLEELEEEIQEAMGKEYVCCATHEQYTYPDYFAYQPDTREKYMKMCEVYARNGYTYIFPEEYIK